MSRGDGASRQAVFSPPLSVGLRTITVRKNAYATKCCENWRPYWRRMADRKTMTGSRVVMEKLAENLWLVDGETVSFLGLPYRTRMTVIRLSDGGLWVHSPVRHSAFGKLGVFNYSEREAFRRCAASS